MLHGLANGGEVVIEGRWGVRCVHKNGFLEMSIITYGKEPKFKYQKFYKPTTPKKSIVPQTNQSKLVVEDGGDIFENL